MKNAPRQITLRMSFADLQIDRVTAAQRLARLVGIEQATPFVDFAERRLVSLTRRPGRRPGPLGQALLGDTLSRMERWAPQV